MKYKITERFKDLVAFYLSIDILKMEDVISASEEEIMNKVLKQVHPYEISYSKNPGRWHTDIKDLSKPSGRRQIAKKKKEDLEKFLLEHYKIQLTGKTAPQKTFKEIFQLVEEQKLDRVKGEEKRVSTENTVERDMSAYRRYFGGTEFENKPIDTITEDDIENICYINLERYDLKEKAFKYLTSILNWVFKHAMFKHWVSQNILQFIDFNSFNKMIADDIPIEERVHSDEEVSTILNAVRKKQEENPRLCSAWALELQILIGARRGELPPLLWTDVTDKFISINKEQLTRKNDFLIANHTKNGKNRLFPLTDELKDFFKRLKEMQDTYYPDSKYLFPADTKNGVITNRAVYYMYRGICKKSKIAISSETVKGPHSFRRNIATSIVDETADRTILASTLLGNSPMVLRKNYYTGGKIIQTATISDKR